MAKIDAETSAARRAGNFEEEEEDIEAFLEAYETATGEPLLLLEYSDAPDAICERPDGQRIGVEHTRVRRSPDDAFWGSVLDHNDEMDAGDTYEEVERLLWQKGTARKGYSTVHTVLLIGLYESDFDSAVYLASQIPLEDLAELGFDEIWLADFKGIKVHAHREVRLFELFPEDYRTVTGRSSFDQKPYG